MKNTTVIYWEDYATHEQELLKKLGVPTLRIHSANSIGPNPFPGYNFILRAKRMSISTYAELYQQFTLASYNIANDPKNFQLHGSFEEYYPMIKEFSPKSIILPARIKEETAIRTVLSSGITAPVFVRSEIESAAKYVGIEGCLMQELTLNQFKDCQTNLDNHVRNYQLLILKEVADIQKHEGNNIEYRAVVMNDKVLSFDYDSNLIPAPELNGTDEAIRRIVQKIYLEGFRGTYFMDFAITTDNQLIIIESKDILNGTIKDVSAFGNALLQ